MDPHPLDSVIFVAFDTETTGLDPRAGRVVELAGVKFTLADGIVDSFQSLIDPGMPIPLDVIRVHGITDDEVRGWPDASIVLAQFFRFLDGPETVLVAHNAPFDLGFLGHEMARHGLTPPENLVLDTLTLARRYHPKLVNHQLGTVARFLDVQIEMQHRAFADSLLVRGILTHLFRDNLSPEQAINELRRSPLRFNAPIKS